MAREGLIRRQLLRPARRPRGVSLVELVLILPMLVLFTFAVMEYGWAFLMEHEITNAARESARYASLSGTMTNEVVASRLQSLMTSYGLGSSGYSYTLSPSFDDAKNPVTRGTLVTVTISVPYNNIVLTGGAGLKILPLPSSLNAKVTVEKEGS